MNEQAFNEDRQVKNKTRDSYNTLFTPKVYSISEALVELNNELVKRKVRLHDVMLENDGLRRGCVPANKFRNILQKYGVAMNEFIWKAIESQYNCNVIDFNQAKLEADLKDAGAKDTSASQSLNQDIMAVLRE